MSKRRRHKSVLQDEDDEEQKRKARQELWKRSKMMLLGSTGESEKQENQAQEEEEDGEVDPLDAFMMDVEQEHERDLLATGTAAMSSYSTEKPNAKTETKTLKAVDEILLPSAPSSKIKILARLSATAHQYEPFRKDFYIEPEDISGMTKKEVAALRDKLDHIKVRGAKRCPYPCMEFTKMGLSDKVLSVLKANSFITPTPIQAQAIPAIMRGLDVIGVAKTGSGKTLAFVLPAVRHALDQRPVLDREGPIILVLAPTRELTIQIHQVFKKFSKCGIRSVAVYGGADVSGQIAQLKRGTEVVVATPGRLIDILTLNNGRITNLRRITYLVLDEADRMFDMGFEPQITKIIQNTRKDRQTAMFSATFPTKVEMLARQALKRPVEIVVGGRLQVCGDVDQIIEVREIHTKFRRLLELLGEWISRGRVLIFSDRQESVDRLRDDLKHAGYTCLTIHGGKDQLDRISTISDFKSGLCDILIATSVAARGLDVKELVLVVNYDAPNHIEDYVHRVGRTGRAGRKGTAVTFITPEEERYAPGLVKALQQSGRDVPGPLQALADSYKSKKDSGMEVERVKDGYVTKGFSFSKDEMSEKGRATKMQMAALGFGDSDDEGDEEDEQGDGLHEYKDETEAEKIKRMLTEFENPNTIRRIEVGKGLMAQPTMAPASEGVSKVQQIANMLAIKNKLALDAVGGNSLDDEPQVHYETDVQINDFPQQARWQVTARESVDQLCNIHETVAITVRGTYVPPGRKPMPGERKLHLFLEGPSEKDLIAAKKDILRILREQTAQVMQPGRPEQQQYAKYSML